MQGWPRVETPEVSSSYRAANRWRMALRRALEWIGMFQKAPQYFRYDKFLTLPYGTNRSPCVCIVNLVNTSTSSMSVKTSEHTHIGLSRKCMLVHMNSPFLTATLLVAAVSLLAATAFQ